MFAATLAAALNASRFPSVLLPSALATMGSHLAFQRLQADQGFWMLPQSAMAMLALVVVCRFWLGLSASATALDIIRGGGRWRPTRWIAATTAFQVGFVSIALALPIFACIVFLVVPGVWLALRWSQAWWVILDGDAMWFDAAGKSADLMHGRYWTVLGIWIALGVGYAGAEWLTQTIGEMSAAVSGAAAMAEAVRLTARLGLDALGLTLVAAIYSELER